MSEEIALACADLETVRQLRAALAVAMQENEQRMLVERVLRAELEAARAEIARLIAWQRPASPDWFWL